MLTPYIQVTIEQIFEARYDNPRPNAFIRVRVKDGTGEVHSEEQILTEDDLISYFDRVWKSTGERMKNYLLSQEEKK